MTIGGILLPAGYTPLNCTYPRPKRNISTVQTYSGAVLFDWGSILPGVTISLKWRSMTKALFDQLDTVYQTGSNVVWVSSINGNYTVAITVFDGTMVYKNDNMDADYLLDVAMDMVISSKD